MADVIALGAHIPQEVRVAAKAAYLARREYDAALVKKVSAMRALSKACKKFAIEPESLEVGDLTGTSLVPASHYEEHEDGNG